MALDKTKLTYQGYLADGASKWRYMTTTDGNTTVKGSSYFNNAADTLTMGDEIMCHTSDGATLLLVKAVDPAAPSVTTAAV